VSWTVVLTGRARRDLTRLDRPVARRILDALTRFADTGQGDVQRVQGTADEWRLRVTRPALDQYRATQLRPV
jgi:mRNA-degrading endonuclease RelE of RelBE toxin-antitoxin system